MSRVGVLNSSVLVLNKFFAAIHVTSARRALTLLYKDSAEVVSINDGQFERYNFETWKEVSKYKELFDTSAIWVFDDIHRSGDRSVLNSVASAYRKPYIVYCSVDGKPFGVINDPILKGHNNEQTSIPPQTTG